MSELALEGGVVLTGRSNKHMLWHMPKKRQIRLFRNGRNQALRIPREWELEGNEALMHREGDRLVIEPVRIGGLLKLLGDLQESDTPFPDVDESLLPLDEQET